MEAERVKSAASDTQNPAVAGGCHAQARESGGARNILLVEDEPLVREVIYQVLQAAGYSVQKARNAEEAQDTQKISNGTLQLLLTDVILPGGSGRDLSRLLRNRYPNLQTIFMSGYAKSAVLPGAERDASVSFLSKPFSVRALLQKVEESLDEKLRSALPNERPFQESSFGG